MKASSQGAQAGPKKRSLWRRMSRFSLRRAKISTRNLERLCRENATTKRTLVLHAEDVRFEPYFPNAFTVAKRPNKQADMHVDPAFSEIENIPSASYEAILCTGLLEHIPDPERFVTELHRILMPGGKLILAASAVFAFHEGPDNYYHFTPFGIRRLFSGWSEMSIRGSCGPFETIAILLQRILMQCEVAPPLRPIIELSLPLVRGMDRFVGTQYDRSWGQGPEHVIDSMAPSNIHAVIIR
jgi:SAM-dependent methyltransferase